MARWTDTSESPLYVRSPKDMDVPVTQEAES